MKMNDVYVGIGNIEYADFCNLQSDYNAFDFIIASCDYNGFVLYYNSTVFTAEEAEKIVKNYNVTSLWDKTS